MAQNYRYVPLTGDLSLTIRAPNETRSSLPPGGYRATAARREQERLQRAREATWRRDVEGLGVPVTEPGVLAESTGRRERPPTSWEMVGGPTIARAGGALVEALDAPPSGMRETLQRHPDMPYTTPLRMLNATTAVIPKTVGTAMSTLRGTPLSETTIDPMAPVDEQTNWVSELQHQGVPDAWAVGLGTTADFLLDPIDWATGGAAGLATLPATLGRAAKALTKRGATGSARSGAVAAGERLTRQTQEAARLAQHGQSFDPIIGTQLVGSQRAGLPKSRLLQSDYENVGRMLEQYPEMVDDLPYLHAMEVSSLSRFSPLEQGEMLRMRGETTPIRLLQAAAKGGEVKRGWYNESRAAVDHLYANDSKQFSKIVASLSPRTSVESDALNSVTFFENWRLARRPTDNTSIQNILNRSVQSSQTGPGVLPAWRQNVTTATQDADAYLSGPKVQAFSQNLTTDPLMTPWGPMAAGDAYTADAWAAGAHQVEQSLLGGRSQLKRRATPEVLQFGDADTTAAYLRATADARRAGVSMSEITGEGLPWAASELQETKWSYFRPLYELSEELRIPATEVVRRGLLTDARIAGTPDFTMLGTGKYGAQVSRDPAKAARIKTLKPGSFRTSTPTSPAIQQLQLEVAQIVEDLVQRRRLTTDFHVGRNRYLPDRVLATSPQEAKAARGARLPALGVRSQQAVNTATVDALERNVVAVALHEGPSVIPVARATGVYGAERNPMFVTGTALPVDESGRLTAAGVQRQQMASRISAGMTMQDAAAWNATAFDQSLPQNVLHAAVPKRLTERQIQGVVRKFPVSGKNANFALVDRGSSFEILRLDGGTFTPAETEWLERYLERAGMFKEGRRTKSGARINPAVRSGSNIAPSDAYTEMGAQAPTGAREVTQKMLGSGGGDYDALTDIQKQALAGPRVRHLADTLLQEYLDAARKAGKRLRPDVQNMLTLIRDGGVPALRDALDDPSQLLPVLAAIGVTGTLASGSDTPATSATARQSLFQ
jgi:hypothetical protein